MRKLIAAINMTVDGVCDHTGGIADDELHRHYNELLRSMDTVIYGRVTYQLMEYWKSAVENPTGNSATDEFAVAMDNIADKVVFSRTLKNVNWKNARVAKRSVEEESAGAQKKAGEKYPGGKSKFNNRHHETKPGR